jgi:glycosyltransferase involved in cell wall biosynthesis
LYGFIELRDRGWKVATCEERFRGALTTLFQKLRHYGFNLMNLRALRRAAKSDVLLVKDDFSFPLTLTAALFRKRLIYLDSMFFMPGNRLKRFLLGINMRCAPLIVSYSQFQVDLWSAAFSIPKNRFVVLPYTIDYPFYARGANQSGAAAAQEPPYILAIGRDLGRDFASLVEATRQLGLRLKLITLPYLIPENAREAGHVEILQRVSYAELFRLYGGATAVAVPLKKDVIYPSGIRAVMESLAVGCPAIVSRTAILEEYFPASSGTVHYVEAEDVDQLKAAIQLLLADDGLRARLKQRGQEYIVQRFQMSAFVERLEQVLSTD